MATITRHVKQAKTHPVLYMELSKEAMNFISLNCDGWADGNGQICISAEQIREDLKEMLENGELDDNENIITQEIFNGIHNFGGDVIIYQF